MAPHPLEYIKAADTSSVFRFDEAIRCISLTINRRPCAHAGRLYCLHATIRCCATDFHQQLAVSEALQPLKAAQYGDFHHRHYYALLLNNEAVDPTNHLFSLESNNLHSRMAVKGNFGRAPALVRCVDWVNSLAAGDRHPNLDNASDSTTFEIDIPSELTSVSRDGENSRLLLSIIQSPANNLLSAPQASELLPVILQNSNLKLFQALVAGRSPATKAIARTFLPGAIESLDCSLVGTLLDSGIDPNMDISRRRPLQIAICSGSIEMTQFLLDRGADVNLSLTTNTSSDPDTLLKVAVSTGRLDLLQLVLRAGSHVNDTEPGRTRSALQYACTTGKTDLVKFLLTAGADVHAPPPGPFGRTALQVAAGAGNIAVVRLLLSYGADVNAPDGEHKGTALECAARSDDVQVTQLLMSYGATGIVSAVDTAGQSFGYRVVNHLVRSEIRSHATLDDAFGRVALLAATRCRDFDLVELLLDCGVYPDALPNAGDTNSVTPLQIAAHDGDIRLAELLISYGADVDAPSPVSFCGTALQEAVRRDNMHLVQVLLRRGANVNAPAAPGGTTALAAAVRRGDMEIFQVLLNHGADMKTQGASVVIEAIGRVSLEVLRFLLDTWKRASGGNLNWTRREFNNQTALQIAVESFDVGLIRLLLEYEADDKSLALRSAVSGAVSAVSATSTHMGIVEMLLSSGAEVGYLDGDDNGKNNTALGHATYGAHLPILSLLLEHRKGPTAYEKSRALQLSAFEGTFDAVRLLLDHGADVNVPSPLTGGEDVISTALQAAAGQGNLEMVRFLLEAGADVESKVPSEKEQGTALQFAAIVGSMSVVMTLVQAGADANAPAMGKYGRTAIEGAAEHGRLDIVQLLLNLGVEAAGSRAIQFARREGHDGVVALLEEAGWEEDG